MRAAANRTAELLAQIAATLGVPVEASSTPRRRRAAPQAAGLIAAMLSEPDGARLAEAFLILPPASRRSLVNVAIALIPETVRASGEPAEERVA